MWTREQEEELAELYERFKEEEGKSQPYDRNEIHSCPPRSLLLLLFLLLLKKTFSSIFHGLISMFFLPDSYVVGSLIPRTEGLGTRLATLFQKHENQAYFMQIGCDKNWHHRSSSHVGHTLF